MYERVVGYKNGSVFFAISYLGCLDKNFLKHEFNIAYPYLHWQGSVIGGKSTAFEVR